MASQDVCATATLSDSSAAAAAHLPSRSQSRPRSGLRSGQKLQLQKGGVHVRCRRSASASRGIAARNSAGSGRRGSRERRASEVERGQRELEEAGREGGEGGGGGGWDEVMVCGVAGELYCTCVPISTSQGVNSEQLCGWEGDSVSPTANDDHPHRTQHGCTRVASGMTSRQTSNRHHSSDTIQCVNNDSKNLLRANAYSTSHVAAQDIPDISFSLTELESNDRYRGLDTSSAHMEHYLSSYTYPNLEQLVAKSLPDRAAVLCPCCVAEMSRLYGGKGGGRGGRQVKPSVILLGEREHHHNLHSPSSAHSCSSIPQGPTLLPSRSAPSDPRPPPASHLQPLSSNVSISTLNKDDIIMMSNSCCNRGSNKKGVSTKSTNWREFLPSSSATTGSCSYNTAKEVYDMGVRWVPQSFPSFVVSSPTCTKNTGSATSTSGKVPQKTCDESKKTGRASSSACSLTNSCRSKKKVARQSERGSGKGDARKSIKTNTLFTFPAVSSAQPPAQSHAARQTMPPIRPQNQGLLATRREFSHLLRHRKSVSFHGGKSSLQYETLCLEGHSATSGPRGGDGDGGDGGSTHTGAGSGHRSLSSTSPLELKVVSPWVK